MLAPWTLEARVRATTARLHHSNTDNLRHTSKDRINKVRMDNLHRGMDLNTSNNRCTISSSRRWGIMTIEEEAGWAREEAYVRV